MSKRLTNCYLDKKTNKDIFGCSSRKSKDTICDMSKELEDKGYLVVRGRVPISYFNEKIGCVNNDVRDFKMVG